MDTAMITWCTLVALIVLFGVAELVMAARHGREHGVRRVRVLSVASESDELFVTGDRMPGSYSNDDVDEGFEPYNYADTDQL